MFSYIDLFGQETVKILALAPIAVLPKDQNQGIGNLLLRTGLKKAEKISIPIVIVLGNPKFYSRFGFKPAINSHIQSPFDVSAEYRMVKLLSSYQQEKYQGKVIYPNIFYEV